MKFIPIKNENNFYIKNLYIIKIIIHQGDTNQLYSVTQKSFKSFLRKCGQCINLSAQEIRDEIIRRNYSPERKINETEFKDPEPENPEISNFNYLLSQFEDLKINNKNNKNKRGKSYNNKTVRNKSISKNIIYKINNINDDDDDDDDNDEEFISDEEEEYVYSNNIKTNKFKVNNMNNINENNYYVVKVTTTGSNVTKKELKQVFSDVKNCKKKFVYKFGNVHGFLNYQNLNDAINIINLFNRYNFSINDCKIKLSLHSVPD